MDDEISDAVVERIPNMASSSRNCVFDVTESLSLDNHANRCKRLLVVIVITYVQEPVSALQDNGESWILVDSRSAVTACRRTLRRCQSFVAQKEC